MSDINLWSVVDPSALVSCGLPRAMRTFFSAVMYARSAHPQQRILTCATEFLSNSSIKTLQYPKVPESTYQM